MREIAFTLRAILAMGTLLVLFSTLSIPSGAGQPIFERPLRRYEGPN